MNLYPVILFAYNRPYHTEQVLQALKQNHLSNQSNLTIFIDGPKGTATEEQKRNIEAVCNIANKEQWCKNVDIHIAEKNMGCRNSIIQGISEVLKKNEAVIVLEDDIVTSPYFLSYMNQCLSFYKERKSVFSVSGMNLPENKFQLPDDYPYDVYVSLRQLNSGWGTWQDRWMSIDWSLDFVDEFIRNDIQCQAYSRGGDDLIKMLIEQVNRKSDAWDIQFTYNHFKNHAISIIPRYSYIDNIGGDGTGIHHLEANNLRFDLGKSIQFPKLLDVLYEDKRIINAFYNAFTSKKRPLWQKIINRGCRLLGGKNIFIIKKKIYC